MTTIWTENYSGKVKAKESKITAGNGLWDNLVDGSRLAFLDQYQGEMNLPLMLATGALKMPNNISEVANAIGANGAVVSSKKEATEIGIDILKRGGNAIDAAIAASTAFPPFFKIFIASSVANG